MFRRISGVHLYDEEAVRRPTARQRINRFGPYIGIVGEGEIRDFTAIGDVVNTASRLQSVAAGARSSCTRLSRASLPTREGEVVSLDLKGKAEPVTARRITVAS
jgi:adenylate cyclase